MSDVTDKDSSGTMTWCLWASVFLHLVIVAVVTAWYNKPKIIRVAPKSILIELKKVSTPAPKPKKSDDKAIAKIPLTHTEDIPVEKPTEKAEPLEIPQANPQPKKVIPLSPSTRGLNLRIPPPDDTTTNLLEARISVQGTVFDPVLKKAIEKELNRIETSKPQFYESYTAVGGDLVKRYGDKCFKLRKAIAEDMMSEYMYFPTKCGGTKKKVPHNRYQLP